MAKPMSSREFVGAPRRRHRITTVLLLHCLAIVALFYCSARVSAYVSTWGPSSRPPPRAAVAMRQNRRDSKKGNQQDFLSGMFGSMFGGKQPPRKEPERNKAPASAKLPVKLEEKVVEHKAIEEEEEESTEAEVEESVPDSPRPQAELDTEQNVLKFNDDEMSGLRTEKMHQGVEEHVENARLQAELAADGEEGEETDAQVPDDEAMVPKAEEKLDDGMRQDVPIPEPSAVEASAVEDLPMEELVEASAVEDLPMEELVEASAVEDLPMEELPPSLPEYIRMEELAQSLPEDKAMEELAQSLPEDKAMEELPLSLPEDSPMEELPPSLPECIQAAKESAEERSAFGTAFVPIEEIDAFGDKALLQDTVTEQAVVIQNLELCLVNEKSALEDLGMKLALEKERVSILEGELERVNAVKMESGDSQEALEMMLEKERSLSVDVKLQLEMRTQELQVAYSKISKMRGSLNSALLSLDEAVPVLE